MTLCYDLAKIQTMNIPVSHILNKNGGDTPKITAHFSRRPGQDTPTGAAASREDDRGNRGCTAQPDTGKPFSTPERRLWSWMELARFVL